MTMTARWWRTGLVTAALSLSLVAACEGDGNPLAAVCCTEFKVGADLSTADFGLRGEIRGEFLAFAQASSDLAATATAALADVQTACRNIAVELGASAADVASAEEEPERERTTELCRLAVAQIGARVTARATLDVAFQPPVCEVSVQAQARCEGACSASGTCDVRANPPVCRGGRLEIVCKGECTAEGGASLYCEGSCSGSCQGACAAQGGVRCNGRCEGTCTAAGSATNEAFDAQGNCIGTCQGTCSATPPGVRCEGSCKGQCDAACRAEANATVTCDGKCSGDYEPLRCEGGTLEGGCDVQASCKANCQASASARAECRPPAVVIRAQVAADPELGRYIQVLEANVPSLLVILKARGQTFVDIAARVASSAGTTGSAAISGDLGVRATACLLPIATTIGEAAVNARVSVQASADVLGSLGVR
ncbi:MAG: hypothetical protein KF850_28700 [Labilithrix sp.]|nr:hypothetical protein [Labilithrix sp.]